MRGVPAPVECSLWSVERIGIHCCAQQHHAYVELLDYQLLIDGGCVGKHFVAGQLVCAEFKGLSNHKRAAVLFFPYVRGENFAKKFSPRTYGKKSTAARLWLLRPLNSAQTSCPAT